MKEVLMELDDDDEREPVTIGSDDEFEDITYEPERDYENYDSGNDDSSTTTQQFQGHSQLKQYMPAKPVKRGIKVWCRADAHNGYLCEFQVYQGREEGVQDTLGTRVVLTKCRKFYKYIFWFLFESSITNAYILHSNYSGAQKMSLKEF